MKTGGLAAHGAQLFDRIVVGERLAELPAFQQRDLIGADDQRIGVAGCHGTGFFLCKAHRGSARRFVRQGCFVHVRCGGLKRELQPFEEFAAVNGGRGKDKQLRIQRYSLGFLTECGEKYIMRASCTHDLSSIVWILPEMASKSAVKCRLRSCRVCGMYWKICRESCVIRCKAEWISWATIFWMSA